MEPNVSDELKGTSSASGNSTNQALDALGSAAFERHASASRSGSPTASQAAGQALDQRSEALCDDPDRAARDREIGRKAIVGLLRCIDTFVQRGLHRAAKRIGASPDFAEAFITEAALPQTEAENIGDLSLVVAEKHGVTIVKWLPELALATSLGQYGCGVITAVSKLSRLQKAQQAQPTN